MPGFPEFTPPLINTMSLCSSTSLRIRGIIISSICRHHHRLCLQQQQQQRHFHPAAAAGCRHFKNSAADDGMMISIPTAPMIRYYSIDSFNNNTTTTTTSSPPQSKEDDISSSSQDDSSQFWPKELKSKLKPLSYYMQNAKLFHQQNNIPRAFRYYMQASILGHPEAHYQVGLYYLNYFKEMTGIRDEFSMEQNFVKMQVDGKERMCFVDSKTLRKMKMEENMGGSGSGSSSVASTTSWTSPEEEALDREILSEKILKTPLKESKKMAMTYFRKGAMASPHAHVPSMLLYGKYLIFDHSRDQDFTKGIKLLTRAAEEYHSGEAYFLLGQLYYNGAKLCSKARRKEQRRILSIDPDLPKAMEYFQKASELNDSSAQYFVGYSLYWGENNLPQNKERAREMLQLAADASHAEANYFLAMMYKEENRTNQYQHYLDRAIQLESPNALFVRADQLLRAGRMDDALKMYRKAAELGSRDASFCTGALLYRQKKYLEAFEWYSKAAKMGSAQAVEAMLDMVEKGQGVSHDEKYANHLKSYLSDLKGEQV